ncbi:MAG: hypothetical protein ABI678_23725 [Kofleriaceae bacterium]
MEIVFIACVATLGACALLARMGKRKAASALREDSHDKLDRALFHLINDVSRKPTPHRTPYAGADHVLMGSRMRALDKRTTAV